MSRLTDLLRQVLHATPPAMGFRPTTPTKPHMVLIAALDGSPSTGTWQGAEAVILSATPKPRGFKSLAKTIKVPWGIWLSDVSSLQTETAQADFVVFEPDKAGLSLMLNNDLGKIMAIEPSCESALLHGISELPVDAIYLKRAPQEAITWLDLMQCRRLSDLIAKPLLVPIAPDTPPAQLTTLWETGVDGIVVTSTEENTLNNLRLEMDKLNLPARRKWLRAHPLVPLVSPTSSITHHEEEEEEYE